MFSLPLTNGMSSSEIEDWYSNEKRESKLNMDEFKKAIYPNSVNNSIVYHHKLHTCVKEDELESNMYICYMSYFQRDDHYESFFFQSLEDIKNFEYLSLFIFRITCDGEIFEYIGDDCIDGIYPGFTEELNCFSGFFGYGSIPYLDFLTTDNFPEISLNSFSNRLYANEMDENSKYGNIMKRDFYLNIASGDSYEYDPNLIRDMIENGSKSMIFVRIIAFRINGITDFELDVYSDRISYDVIGSELDIYSHRKTYDDYEVWFYAIPNSNIPVDEACDLLLEKFRKIYESTV